MRNVPNDIVTTLIRCLPTIINNVSIGPTDTKLFNAVRKTKIIIKRLNKIENEQGNSNQAGKRS